MASLTCYSRPRQIQKRVLNHIFGRAAPCLFIFQKTRERLMKTVQKGIESGAAGTDIKYC